MISNYALKTYIPQQGIISFFLASLLPCNKPYEDHLHLCADVHLKSPTFILVCVSLCKPQAMHIYASRFRVYSVRLTAGSLLTTLRSFTSQTTGFSIQFKVQMKGSGSNSYPKYFTGSSLQQPFSEDSRSLIKTKHSYPATTPRQENAISSAALSFIRPYALIGLVISMISTSLLPVQSITDLSPTFFIGLLKTVISMVFIFLYNAMVNQLFDIEIDKVNKPYLPLSSGRIPMNIGAAITFMTSFMSISMGLMIQSPPLLCAILTFFLFGSAYSIDLPFLRWKKNPVLAVVCTVAWGLSLQVGIFLHIQKYVLGKPMVFTRAAIFAVIFRFIFDIVVALIKDLPDVDGDIANGCDNMTIRFGKEKVFWGCTALMLATYGVAVAFGLSSPFLSSKLITVLAHIVLAFVVSDRARRTNLSDDESTQSYYMFLWKISSIEALLILFLR